LRLARIAVAAIFFINGFGYANWVPRLAEIQSGLELSEGDLGLALLMVAIGSIAAMPTSGGLIARYGSRALTRLTAILFGISLPLIGFADGFVSLCLAFLFYGAAAGVLDVSMNAQGIAVERAYRRPIMSSLHGMFSTGAMVGAGVTALVASQGVGMMAQFLAVAALTAVLGFLITRVMLPASADAGGQAQGFVLPGRNLLAFGVIAFCGLLGEGAIGDWSSVYLARSLGADVQMAALAFAAFSVMMALGRFSGDRIVARFGEAVVVSGGGVLAALGLGGTLLIGQPVVAIGGLAMVGAGLSCVFPVTLSAATRVPGVTPGTAIAGVCTIGYGAFLLGPPAIGGFAELTSLPMALGLVVALSVLIAALGRLTARRPDPATVSA
jgi:MFS family permease